LLDGLLVSEILGILAPTIFSLLKITPCKRVFTTRTNLLLGTVASYARQAAPGAAVPTSGAVWAGAGAQVRLGLQCTGAVALLRCAGACFLLSRRDSAGRFPALSPLQSRAGMSFVLTRNRLGCERAQSFSQVRADPMKAMTSVLALCKHGGVPNGFC
jgi:hypothetical protein